MLIAFRRVSLLFLAGQISTQMPHPVQSSGATWIVYFIPCHSRSRASVALHVAGALRIERYQGRENVRLQIDDAASAAGSVSAH